ncbi:MAG: UDP-N-acetylmuramoyl-L-alanyl-D-glutamate--2,6-diaminopimelate ligase [Candidatus Endonucleobacter bathymodioli]|uniref:UDP-N-acetylmuramoyl-L-alanyl-D-glutamate--2,6-diaminopimelate ligase n=1 Tax=Candidatus Endonucleibacter bathymodioli TaxID=539814 RepID=A0AA90NM50_9GAMM|nr:UDP-N-acetylmuramoyl-L-alanyl-D-glutamate--2,6-diaminopimelate ligase [Candidatus Endonucleobacter bathymodioli]
MTGRQIATFNDVLLQLGAALVDDDRSISGLVLDSRKIVGGELFLAMPGIASDGREFVVHACQRGASAILAEADGKNSYSSKWAGIDIPVVCVQDLKSSVGIIAARYYRSCSEKVKVIGVTGTNGKTSCCWFLANILSVMGQRCAIMGTLGKGLTAALEPMLNTTPDVISTHKFIASLDGTGTSSLAMEVSSHGLEQGRVDGVRFDVGVFTNISRDHLDSYRGMDEYAAAKSLLFSDQLLANAIINQDDPYADMMLSACPKGLNIITWSLSDSSANVYASEVKFLVEGMEAIIHSPWGIFEISTPLMGRFNLENLLAVMATLGVFGCSLSKVVPLLSSLEAVPGRMQRLGGGNKPLVLVDYAHTPSALKSVLSSLREHGAKKLSCVFGCGGDRDKGKRPLMLEAAVQGADNVILTSDNPRTESPEAIISDALEGVDKYAWQRLDVVVSRADAIAKGIATADIDDIIVVAGKGCEAYQEVNGVRYPFDDCYHVGNALEKWNKP